jgi:serine/threonine-protein phosphatase 4 regulatory subunit 1
MSDEEGLPEGQSQQHGGGGDDGSSSVRFEDLTVDDDVPIIDRVVRYSRSSIALQRLVHVKMLAETAALAGYVLWL